MRKLFAAWLLAAMILALCACGGANQSNSADPATPATDPTATTQADGTEENTQAAVATEPTHEHSYTDQVVAPTCTQEGYTLHTCACGDSYKDTVVAVTEHTYKETALEPTCTEDGGRVFTCECGDTYKNDIKKATGHTWGDWQTVKEPTTTAEGKSERKCSVCNQTESRKLDKLIENHNHKYTEQVTTQATCTAEGVKTFTCSCGGSYTESIAKKAHEYTKATTDPTCTARGYVTVKCKNCTDSYIEQYIDAKGHSYKSVVTNPTCTAKGYTTYTCKTCSHSYKSNEVAATGHKMSAATCTTAEKCSVCGESGKAATGHQWGKWTSSGNTQHTRKCSVCSQTEAKNHNWNAGVVTKAATCTAEGVKNFTCNDCGQTRIENISKTDHSYGKWSKISDSQHQRTCTACSNTETAAHGWDDGYVKQAATCETVGTMYYTCSTCGATKKETLSAIGHNWKYVSTSNGVTTEKCSNCNKTRTVNAESHSHAAANLETMTVAKASSKCAALGNYALEKYSGMTDVNISICTKCGYVDYTSVKSIYTPQQETAKFIALAKSVRDPFLRQDAIDIGYTAEEAEEYVNEYKHVSDTICINHAIRRAKELSTDYSHNGAPANCAELINAGQHNVGDDFQSWCNSTPHYNKLVSWGYPYVGYTRYIVGDPTFETITIYSVVILGYHDR